MIPLSRSVIRALEQARDLVADGWAQRISARNRDGRICYCAVGALAASAGNRAVFEAAQIALIAELPPRFRTVAEYNDHGRTTHGDVLHLYTRAITTTKRLAVA